MTPTPPPVTRGARRTRLLALAVLAVLVGVVFFAAHNRRYLHEIASSDFAINRAGAQQLIDGEPLYDRKAERARLFAEAGDVGPAEREAMTTAFSDTYSSFIGSPPVALVHAPWAHVEYGTALATFRGVEALAMVAAVAIAGFTVRRDDRVVAWLVGAAALLVFFPVVSSLGLGQIDGLVMLALAIALWASTRERWRTVGAALAVAALLKVSPILLLVFMVLRVKRGRVGMLVGAAVATAGLLVTSAVVGRAGDVVTWVRDVAPSLSTGNRTVENQSLPAFLHRLLAGGDDIVRTTTSLGGLRYVGIVGGVIGVLALWWWRRDRPYDPLELGAVVLIALLAAPVSWAHYLSWAILPLMLLASPERLVGPRARVAVLGGLLVLATALMALPVRFPSPDDVAAHPWTRVYSGAGTLAVLVYLVVAVLELAPDRSRRDAPEPSPRPSAAPPVGAPGARELA
jgi:alpha-1,2-mannosyltransferase